MSTSHRYVRRLLPRQSPGDSLYYWVSLAARERRCRRMRSLCPGGAEVSSDPMEAVQRLMRTALAGLEGAGGALLRAMLSHHLGWDETEAQAGGKPATLPAGKLVRPRLCLLSCAAVGGDPEVAAPAAAAIELVHNFSLIHDDIEDRDEMRRGRATVWRRWGEAQAINAGDGMYSLAYAALGDLGAAGAGDTRHLRAVALLSRACVRLCEGQAHDLALHNQPRVSPREYLDMIGRKTAALMSCATQLGALFGGANDQTQAAFRQFGFDLGIAFQIRDDLLGIWGDPDKTGKSVGTDLSRKRCSYPVICALERARGEERETILAAQGASSPERIAAVVDALQRLGALAQAEDLVAQKHERAWAALGSVQLAPGAAHALRELTEFLTVRQR